MFSLVKLSGKPWYARENLPASLFFGALILIGYLSVVANIYMIAMGETYIGERDDMNVVE